jgi:teichuronic acid biosynthesis glycosyltransferase TuaG
MNFISIIIPFYKKKKYIEETINSVLSQSFKNYEIIIVYDEENKDNLGFIELLKEKSDKIKILTNQQNQGAGNSRNIAISESRGNYLAFIDADDMWHEDKLKLQLEFMDINQISASHTSYNIIDDGGKVLSIRIAKDMTYCNLLKSCDIGLSTVILKKDLIKSDIIFPNLKTKEDYVLWLKISKNGTVFKGLDINLSSWRNSKNSLSSSTIRKLIDGFSVYRNFMKFGIIKSIYYLFRLGINFLKK